MLPRRSDEAKSGATLNVLLMVTVVRQRRRRRVRRNGMRRVASAVTHTRQETKRCELKSDASRRTSSERSGIQRTQDRIRPFRARALIALCANQSASALRDLRHDRRSPPLCVLALSCAAPQHFRRNASAATLPSQRFRRNTSVATLPPHRFRRNASVATLSFSSQRFRRNASAATLPPRLLLLLLLYIVVSYLCPPNWPGQKGGFNSRGGQRASVPTNERCCCAVGARRRRRLF